MVGMVAGCSVEVVDMAPVAVCSIVEVDLDLYSISRLSSNHSCRHSYTCGF